MLMVAFAEDSKDAEVMADMAKVKRKVTKGKQRDARLVEAVESLWSKLFADDACIVSQSPGSLEKMMPIIVRVAGRFGLLVSECKTETICMLVKWKKACARSRSMLLGWVFSRRKALCISGVRFVRTVGLRVISTTECSERTPASGTTAKQCTTVRGGPFNSE
ncbi:unnamed protein product [Pylaiella littoralis]